MNTGGRGSKQQLARALSDSQSRGHQRQNARRIHPRDSPQTQKGLMKNHPATLLRMAPHTKRSAPLFPAS